MRGLDDNDEGWMGNVDAERVLFEAFRAHARNAVGDQLAVPPMSDATGPAAATPASAARTRHIRWAAPLAAAVVIAAVILATALGSRGRATSGHGSIAAPGPRVGTTASQVSATTGSGSGATSTSTPNGAPHRTVRVSSDLNDGSVVGVGEPIVLNFLPTPTDSTAFTKAVTVTVNGMPASGAWYWEKPYASQPVQAHYREAGYWPANSTIEVKLPIGGLSAGAGLAYSGALNSITFRTGDAHVSTVDASTLTMTVTSNGATVRTIPVSLGAAKTPTFNGTKIVMQKGEDVPGTNTLRPQGTVMMSGPHYTNDPVPWSVRITASGEYVHAAAWNTHIGTRSTSNGCTNLKPADGAWFYAFSQLGDVVRYVHTDGTRMNPLDGLGDWNVGWALWLRGGLLVNH